MIGIILTGGNRAEVGGSNPLKSLKTLGGGKGGSSGSSYAKSLKRLRAEAEVKTYTTYRPAAFGAGRLRTYSSRTFLAVL